jgi:ABC-2 type transport system permease protein
MTTISNNNTSTWGYLQFKVILAELRRAFLLEWRYPLEGLGKVIFLYLLFRAVTWGGSLVGPALNIEAFRTGQTERLAGYTLFFLLITTVQNGANLIRQESELGVFEQVYLSPIGLASVIIIRGLSTIIANLLPMALFFILGMLTLTVDINQFPPTIFLILLLGALGMQGIGLILSGIALIFKRSQSLIALLTMFLLLLSIVPTSEVTGISGVLASWFPFTQSISLTALELRGVPIEIEQYIILATSSSILFIIGWIIFRSLERLVLDRGFMGQH